jgi:conserved oligomeric Golgi complex subunit 6
LKEVSDSLASKTDAVVELEVQIVTLQSSLESASADIETNKRLAEQLTQEKSLLEVQLKEAISNLQSDQQAGESALESLREEVGISYIISAQSQLSIFHSFPPQRMLCTTRMSLFRTFMPKSKP